MAQLEEEFGHGSDCEDEYDGGVSLSDYDQKYLEDDTPNYLHGYLQEQRTSSSSDNPNLYDNEPPELPGKEMEHATIIDAAPSLNGEVIGTGIGDLDTEHETFVEELLPLPSDFLDPAIGQHPFAPPPQQSANQGNPLDTNHNQTLVHPATSGLEMNHEYDFTEPDPFGNVPLESSSGEASLEVPEPNLNQLYPQLPSWWYFIPHNELRNMSLIECLHFWGDGYLLQQDNLPNQSDYDGYSFSPLTPRGIYRGMRDRQEKQVTESDIIRGRCDAQGLVWDSFGADRAAARKIRCETYFNQANCFPSYPYAKLVNRKPMFCSARFMNLEARARAWRVPNTRKYFCISRMNLEHKISVPHFQLHHTVSASSRNAIFFPTATPDEDGFLNTGARITCLNPNVPNSSIIIDSANIGPYSDAPRMQKIFTLTAQDDILLAGGLDGEYAIKSLSSTPFSPFSSGKVSDGENNSINHIHTYLDRCSGLPRAVLSSNDCYTHILDCMTNTFVSRHNHTKQVNCAATSPHNRLRILVRDAKHPLLVEADSGKRVGKLSGHSDFGFACDWSGDGIHIATGAQDGLVNIYDARSWRKPLKTFKAELGGVRSLAFSPIGNGSPLVLVMAEAADFVHVVGGVGWSEGQTVDFFGEVAGVGFEPEGERFWVGVADPEVGGLMEFERNGDGRFENGRRWRGEVLRARREDDELDI
ncbi:MAG: hypothetical protein L6R41_008463 [Letrouitia leprolyta]|nr:MAG: hypothetical protein L6R41_008463 [Letrouitia leprolyta]